jgi:ABC-type branched-subunit amino acid transport system ATPase component
MLRAEGLRAGYGTTPVLQDLDLSVAAGERVAVLGRNGAGKTTLLKTLMGQLPIMAGTVTFDGQDVSRLPAHARARLGIAYVPQGRQIFPGLSVLDNLRVAAYGTGRRDWRATLREVLDQFPVLREKADLAGAGLSGGQQQILALGRALMTRPRLLLLDENERQGITVVLVEQNLEFAVRVASHAQVMDKGRIVRDLPSAEILADRQLQHEYMGV